MNPLKDFIRSEIAESGVMTFERYMSLALAHPQWGYYRSKDPLGLDGDFTTAPEISQIFGELIGLFLADYWLRAGKPKPFSLVELGPGRGTLASDLLRATKGVPEFHPSFQLHLVETSPVLRAKQQEKLQSVHAIWHDDCENLPDQPTFIVANEFFDALPIRAFEMTAVGWCERGVGLDHNNELTWALLEPAPLPNLPKAQVGQIFEWHELGQKIIYGLAKQINRFGGVLLVIDYGHLRPGFGETIQALKNHQYHPILADPGLADITAHVCFSQLAQAARDAGAQTYEVLPQGRFLSHLGCFARAEQLIQSNPSKALEVRAAIQRLTAADAMGDLFKVMVVTRPDGPIPAGF